MRSSVDSRRHPHLHALQRLPISQIRSKAYIPEGLPPAVHKAFCEHVVSTFKDMTHDVIDLATLAAHLWGSWLEPIESGKVCVGGGGARLSSLS